MDEPLVSLTYRLERAGAEVRPIGYRSPWRRFPNTLITQLQGGGYLLRTPTEQYRIEDGMGFLIPAQVRTQFRLLDRRPTTTVYSHFHCQVVGALDLFALLDGPVILPRSAAQQVGKLNRKLIALQRQHDDQTLRRGAAALQLGAQLIALALSACPELETLWRDPLRMRLSPVLRHLRDHLEAPLSKTALARIAGLSVPRFHVLFKQAFGHAPMAFVREQRLQRARRLLAHTDLPIGVIAQRCGIADALYFSRLFRQFEGLTPSAYRQAFGRDA